ncbi:MAG: NAD(P)/FAD-dependent oxidoreductase [Bacilli bacterium]|nr:NAD(P)/FAD-dependent oxidoreductase [Bacilli bacterium]
MTHYDVLIIGSGIVGSAIAFELSKYDLKVLVVEKENDVALGTTKANSGIIHAGYDPKPGTLMARLNVEGNKLTRELAPVLNFHFKQVGSLVIGSTDEEHKVINDLYSRGVQNGVEGLKILKTAGEVHALEPRLNPEIDYALLAPTAGIVAPWELALAFSYTAVTNGVRFVFDAPVSAIDKTERGYLVTTAQGSYEADYVINAAGLHSDDIYKLALKDKAEQSFTIVPCKGEYYLLDKDQGSLVRHVIFQTPTALGKGVLVSQTVHGNLIVGPNAMYDGASKDDTSTLSEGLDQVRTASARTISSISFGSNIRNFSGVRATLKGQDDFLIAESPILPHFINFAGIKSPGVSCGPAFGKEAVRILANAGLNLAKKNYFTMVPLPTYFKEMSMEDKKKAIQADSRYGQVICRCETVTEAEILAAIHAPIPAHTIDGVKRRTNAGMGRCQGGFCGPKIFHLLMDSLHLKYNEVYQDKTGSQIVVSETKKEAK